MPLKQPTRAVWVETTCLGSLQSAPPLFGLAPGGVYHAIPVTSNAVRSYRTLSPLPVSLRTIGGLLSVALSLGSRPAGVTRHPCFVEPGLSSVSLRITRLPGPLAARALSRMGGLGKSGIG